jgi:thiol-disulfide isomerase/thioredoxin
MLTVLVLNAASAQTTYTSTLDANKVLILNGIVSKNDIQDNPSFGWYSQNQKGYVPASSILDPMIAAKDKFQFLVFGGTWCEDTQSILPKFFRLQELSGIQEKNISFFAVDRQKQTSGNMANTFKIVNVPTIIVLKDGKEVGRVVEYGKTGKWDQEVADLLK